MGKIIDVAEVQKALDRAAHDAKHGPRGIRAGRFVHAGTAGDRTSGTAKPRTQASKTPPRQTSKPVR
jgi:hypothetical protein